MARVVADDDRDEPRLLSGQRAGCGIGAVADRARHFANVLTRRSADVALVVERAGDGRDRDAGALGNVLDRRVVPSRATRYGLRVPCLRFPAARGKSQQGLKAGMGVDWGEGMSVRARILWAATFALLLFGLAVGPSSGAGASGRPVMPSSNWSVVASMPQDIYGAATASNGVFSYAIGGYSTSTGTTLDTFYRYNPVNERWENRPAMPDAVAMASAVYVPTSDRIYVFGGFDPNTGTFSDATRVFDLATGTWGTAANMPGPRAFMASGLQHRERQDLPGRRQRHRRPRQREGDDVGVRPCGEHVHHARADSARCRRLRLRRDRRPLLSGGRSRCARRGGGLDLGLQHRREQLGGQDRHAEPDERRRQRSRERQALELRRRERFRARRYDRVLRPGDRHLDEWPKPERSSHARGRNGDRIHARGRRRVRRNELHRPD